jgi:hypothetical protein
MLLRTAVSSFLYGYPNAATAQHELISNTLSFTRPALVAVIAANLPAIQCQLGSFVSPGNIRCTPTDPPKGLEPVGLLSETSKSAVLFIFPILTDSVGLRTLGTKAINSNTFEASMTVILTFDFMTFCICDNPKSHILVCVNFAPTAARNILITKDVGKELEDLGVAMKLLTRDLILFSIKTTIACNFIVVGR